MIDNNEQIETSVIHSNWNKLREPGESSELTEYLKFLTGVDKGGPAGELLSKLNTTYGKEKNYSALFE